MHVQQSPGPRALVQIIDILRDQQQLARPLGVKPRHCFVRCIGLDRAEVRPPRIVERMHQRGIAPFKVTARVRGLGRSARNTVHYTGINCSGRWTYLGQKGSSYRFREKITSGRGGSCKGVGTVTLTPAGANRVDYVFRGGGVVSRGVLVRAAKPIPARLSP